MRKKYFAVSCLSAVLLLTVFVVACRAAKVTIAHSGNGVYEVRGTDFSSVAGIDLQISYDRAGLSSPTVAKGSLVTGALMDSNTSSAGNIRIAVITTRPISGSGTLATITFRPIGSSSGMIRSMSAELIDKNGARLNSQVQIKNPADSTRPDAVGTSDKVASSGATAASSGTNKTSGTSATVPNTETVTVQSSIVTSSSSAATTGQTVMKPGDDSRSMPPGMPVVPPGEVPVQGKPVDASHAVSAAGTAKALPVAGSVLERFQRYGGNKTKEAYTALFDQSVNAECRQEPPVGLSDGNSTVKLILTRSGTGNAAPNFAFAGVRLVSMKRVAGNSWIIEVRPDKGVNQATVTALVNNLPMKYPITVAQPLEMHGGSAGLKATDRDFAVFLQQRGTDKAPMYDLNRDGKRDYLDDYIFTANYIAAAGKVKIGKAPAAN